MYMRGISLGYLNANDIEYESPVFSTDFSMALVILGFHDLTIMQCT